MTTTRRAGFGLVACLTLVTGAVACVSSPFDAVAIPTAHPDSTGSTAATDPDGSVTLTTRHRTMVIDDGERPPQLCVGGYQQSLPPNCYGVELIGWKWDAVGDAYEQRGPASAGSGERGPVRWGEFMVAGDYARDDNTLTVTHASVHGTPDGREEARDCEHVEDRTEDVLSAETETMKRVWSSVEEDLGIAVFAGGSDYPCAGVSILVAYDDGDLQAELDSEFGEGVVRVESALALRE